MSPDKKQMDHSQFQKHYISRTETRSTSRILNMAQSEADSSPSPHPLALPALPRLSYSDFIQSGFDGADLSLFCCGRFCCRALDLKSGCFYRPIRRNRLGRPLFR